MKPLHKISIFGSKYHVSADSFRTSTWKMKIGSLYFRLRCPFFTYSRKHSGPFYRHEQNFTHPFSNALQ